MSLSNSSKRAWGGTLDVDSASKAEKLVKSIGPGDELLRGKTTRAANPSFAPCFAGNLLTFL
jgi:hypothetical protein